MQVQSRASATFADASAGVDPSREFEFSDTDFRSLASLAYDRAGISLASSKKNLVYSRLSRRLRALQINSFREYREYISTHDSDIESFLNSISTNLTKFFRESHHFDHFRTHIAAAYAQAAFGGTGGRLRVWSAGCSTGEEPYTIAVTLQREIRKLSRHDIRILATDIDTNVLATAASGIYQPKSIDEVPNTYRDFFATEGNNIVMGDDVRSLVAFRHLNLMETWPFRGPFDAIFCRNVMIYFDAPTKSKLIERFTQHLRPGGWLYIGHSESLTEAHPGLELIGRTIYRREA